MTAYFVVAAALWPILLLVAIKFWKWLDIDIREDFLAFCFATHVLVIMPIAFAACWIVTIPMAAVIGLLYIIWRAIKIN